VSLVGGDLWEVIDLYWLCHAKQPGFDGSIVVRQCFPHAGTVTEQDGWLMWAFELITNVFYGCQNDLKEDRHIRQQQQQAQEKMKRG